MKIDVRKVIETVLSVRPLLLDHERAARIRVKGVADFVTQVDVQVQEHLKRALGEQYPDIQFMGEEKDNSEIDFGGSVWILDPVDGTTNLIHDFRQSAVSLALCEERILKFGVIYQPYTGEIFHAQRGKGAWLNGVPIHVSDVKDMERSLISIGTSPYNHEFADRNFELFKAVFLRCSDIRRLGSAAMDLAYVACGRTDAFFEQYLKPWDYAAGLLLIQEAGGTVTDFRGNPVDVTGPSDMIAGNGSIGEQLLKEVFPDYFLDQTDAQDKRK